MTVFNQVSLDGTADAKVQVTLRSDLPGTDVFDASGKHADYVEVLVSIGVDAGS